MLSGCKGEADKPQSEDGSDDTGEMGLKDYYADYFPIGVAVAPNSREGEAAELILKEFGSITPENVMKMGPIHPEPDRFFWKEADSLAAFARENDLLMRGHALVWHQQAGNWIFEPREGEVLQREELLGRMKIISIR